MLYPIIRICFALSLLFISCNNPKVIEKKNDKGIVTERFQVIIKDKVEVKEGLYERFDSTGQLIEQSQYKDDMINGARKLYQNGIMESEELRVNDIYQGEFKSYYPNGIVQLEAMYVDNVMTGDVKVYYPSGMLKEIVRFANNVEDGPFSEYHENGKIKAEGNYKQSEGAVEDGELKLYDTSGIIIRIMNCELGKCFTKWSKDTLTL